MGVVEPQDSTATTTTFVEGRASKAPTVRGVGISNPRDNDDDDELSSVAFSSTAPGAVAEGRSQVVDDAATLDTNGMPHVVEAHVAEDLEELIAQGVQKYVQAQEELQRQSLATSSEVVHGVAVPVQPEQDQYQGCNQWYKKKKWWLLVLLVLVVIGIAVGVAVPLSLNSDKGGSDELKTDSTSVPTTVRTTSSPTAVAGAAMPSIMPGTITSMPSSSPSTSLPTFPGPPSSAPSLDEINFAAFGFPYARSASTGWLMTIPPNGRLNSTDFPTSDEEVVVLDLTDARQCAAQCLTESAVAGAWNTRVNICWCFLNPVPNISDRRCLEPCIPEEGIEFSVVPYETYEICPYSYCEYYDDPAYCTDVDFAAETCWFTKTCQARLAEVEAFLNEEVSSSSHGLPPYESNPNSRDCECVYNTANAIFEVNCRYCPLCTTTAEDRVCAQRAQTFYYNTENFQYRVECLDYVLGSPQLAGQEVCIVRKSIEASGSCSAEVNGTSCQSCGTEACVADGGTGFGWVVDCTNLSNGLGDRVDRCVEDRAQSNPHDGIFTIFNDNVECANMN